MALDPWLVFCDGAIVLCVFGFGIITPPLLRWLTRPEDLTALNQRVTSLLRTGNVLKLNHVFASYCRRNGNHPIKLVRVISEKKDLSFLHLPAGSEISGFKAQGSKLDRAVLAGVDLISADLKASTAFGINVVGAKLGCAELSRVDWTEAVCDGTSFGNANLVDAVFVKSSFVRASFGAARMARARFEKADLRYATFDRAEGWNAVFDGAMLHDTSFFGGSFSEATFCGAKLAGADFRGCDLSGAKLNGADLAEVRFNDETKLDRIDITRAFNVPLALKERIERELPRTVDCAVSNPKGQEAAIQKHAH